jgi:hypothetical protein
MTALRGKQEPFYSEIGRPSIDPDLMIRMLIVGDCHGIHFERKSTVANPFCECHLWTHAPQQKRIVIR